MQSTWARRLRLPLIAAPMFRVSGPGLVSAACINGVIGAFPTANCRSMDELDAWLAQIRLNLQQAQDRSGVEPAPFCPNLIMRRDNLRQELACLVRHRVEMVITSVGSPAPAVRQLHDIGCTVFADVASVRHAEKALASGADGLILLTAGAGGQTGWANGFAFARAVRAFFNGPLVLAGGISDGYALRAARVLGCDLAYMGTRFIATTESLASDGYKQMLLSGSLDDVQLTSAFTGLPTNMLRPSIVACGLDPEKLSEGTSAQIAAEMYGSGASAEGPRRWTDLWSAGHSVAGVDSIRSVEDLVRIVEQQYQAATPE
ncbi:MAG: 2-nitropropane dioxygenase [Hydrocarboniphaga sp.]|uniref:NAD(P)H-dependent flavin oxidoreductase n=1 Tax=Hydrocarboniphaga sp. TaxID=2033016 RepID=UPI0026319790|nr:nitronate monooxygenase [Hydrocarboniphaga sp.]MDB5970167.1 2-nitropropane dioxygenase [Hydrocarboniphaga sp.]